MITNFQEYMNARGNIEKPKIKVDGENIDPPKSPSKPPQGGASYQQGKNIKPSNKDNNPLSGGKLHKTNDTNLVKDTQLACKVVQKIQENSMFAETLIRHLKNNKVLGCIIAEALQHYETYQTISEVMFNKEHGAEIYAKLNKAINEEVAKPFSDQLDAIDIQEEEPNGELENSNQADGEGINDEDDLLNLDINEDPAVQTDPTNPMNPMEMNPMDNPQQPEMEPQNPSPLMNTNTAARNFQRAMMRSYQRKMMRRI